MHFSSCFHENFRWFFVFRTWKNFFSKMLNYISPLFVEIEIWKFGVIFAILQGIICQSFSLFAFVIREKERFFWEGPRLMDHPVSVYLHLSSRRNIPKKRRNWSYIILIIFHYFYWQGPLKEYFAFIVEYESIKFVWIDGLFRRHCFSDSSFD